MTKQEFEERIEEKISEDKYRDIEVVYTWHPCIDNVIGKDQIAQLYKTFGMRIILDMLPTAKKAMEIENEIFAVQHKLADLKKEYAELKGE